MSGRRHVSETVSVDCATGRRLGCQTFCCRLLVRLEPEERRAQAGQVPKGFVDKDPDGLCVHIDRETFWCRIWAERPRVCREYDCNADPLLQVALRRPFRTIVDLVAAASQEGGAADQIVRVPSAGPERSKTRCRA